MATTSESVTTTFRIQRETYNKFLRRLPKRGERSRVLQLLLAGYLDGSIPIILPKKI
jgi:hypothetical protein